MTTQERTTDEWVELIQIYKTEGSGRVKAVVAPVATIANGEVVMVYEDYCVKKTSIPAEQYAKRFPNKNEP